MVANGDGDANCIDFKMKWKWVQIPFERDVMQSSAKTMHSFVQRICRWVAGTDNSIKSAVLFVRSLACWMRVCILGGVFVSMVIILRIKLDSLRLLLLHQNKSSWMPVNMLAILWSTLSLSPSLSVANWICFLFVLKHSKTYKCVVSQLLRSRCFASH